MESIENVIIESNPELLERVKASSDKLLESPEIHDFILQHELTEEQTRLGMSAFNEYLASADNEFYRPALTFDNGYVSVVYQETDKLAEMKIRSKALYLETKSVLGDASIKVASFENFKVHTREEQDAFKFALACARFYGRGGRGNCVLSGSAGTGKSHLSMSILKEFSKRDQTALYVSFEQLLRLIKDSWDTQSKFSEEYALAMCREVDLLVLDDIGAEKTSNWADKILCSILNNRECTIITTNYSKAKLRETYEERTFSRIYRDVGQREFHFKNISDKRMNPTTTIT